MIQKSTILVFALAMLALIGCSSLDRELQGGIESMAATIEARLDPGLPPSFQAAAKKQAAETVKYAECNDPLLRRNVAEMLDTITHDLDPAIPEADRARILAHAEAMNEWIKTGKRPESLNPAETEPGPDP